MKKILNFSIILALLFCCKTKKQSTVSLSIKTEDTDIHKYHFREPYNYNKPTREPNSKIEITDIEESSIQNNVYASNDNQAVVTDFVKKQEINFSRNTKKTLEKKELISTLKQLEKGNNNQVIFDVLAYFGLIIGCIISLVLLFYGLILAIIASVFAPELVIVGLILVLLGGAIGGGAIALFSKYQRKKRERINEENEKAMRKETPKVVTPEPVIAPKTKINATEQKLKDAKELYDKELIDETEYKQLKLKIINEDLKE